MGKNKNQKQTSAKLIARILTGIIFLFMFAPVSLAQITCDNLNIIDNPKDANEQKQNDENQKKMEDYIVTILEEEIGTSGGSGESVTPSEGAAESMTCFRETTCTTANDKKTCTSKYVTTCEPGDEKFCQRVQVLISQSGVDLLMSYLGIIYRWAASVIGIVSVAYLIYGGFLIGTAQDDSAKIDKAKEKIFQSLTGLVLLFLSAIILYTINPNFFTI